MASKAETARIPADRTEIAYPGGHVWRRYPHEQRVLAVVRQREGAAA